MAISLNTDQYIEVTDDPALSFPDGSWSIGGWIKMGGLSGGPNDYPQQYVMSWKTGAAQPFFHIFIRVQGSADKLGWIVFNLKDSDAGDTPTLIEYGPLFYPNTGWPMDPLNTWRHVMLVKDDDSFAPSKKAFVYFDGQLQRRGGMTIVPTGTSPSWPPDTPAATSPLDEPVDHPGGGDDIDPIGPIDVPGNMIIGCYWDLDPNFFFHGLLGHWAKWDRALHPAEVLQLYRGIWPYQMPGDLKWYLPMEAYALDELFGYEAPLTATNNGGTVASNDPPLHAMPLWPVTPSWSGESFEPPEPTPVTWYYRHIPTDQMRPSGGG